MWASCAPEPQGEGTRTRAGRQGRGRGHRGGHAGKARRDRTLGAWATCIADEPTARRHHEAPPECRHHFAKDRKHGEPKLSFSSRHPSEARDTAIPTGLAQLSHRATVFYSVAIGTLGRGKRARAEGGRANYLPETAPILGPSWAVYRGRGFERPRGARGYRCLAVPIMGRFASSQTIMLTTSARRASVLPADGATD
jgi:hypothetical protein